MRVLVLAGDETMQLLRDSAEPYMELVQLRHERVKPSPLQKAAADLIVADVEFLGRKLYCEWLKLFRSEVPTIPIALLMDLDNNSADLCDETYRTGTGHVVFKSPKMTSARLSTVLINNAYSKSSYKLLNFLGAKVSARLKNFLHFLIMNPQNYQCRNPVERIADAVGISSKTLSRLIKKELGIISILDLFHISLVLKACDIKLLTGNSISTIAMQLGYSKPSILDRQAREILGCSLAHWNGSTEELMNRVYEILAPAKDIAA